MRAQLDSSDELPHLVVRGWELFADLVPDDVGAAVSWVHDDVTRLSAPLSRTSAATLVHGDFWLPNIAVEPQRVVLLDWAIAALAPPALDLACFLVGSASHVDAPRQAIVDDFVAVSREHHDQRSLRLCLFAALAEMGWNKALDIVDHPHPRMRAATRNELDWWTAAARDARDALDRGLLG